MHSPLVAMLWELWRMTRVEAAWRFALGIVASSVGLIVFDAAPNGGARDFSGAAIGFMLIVLPHFFGWLTLSRFNNGRPGFPFYLLYTRPVPTTVIVGLPMAYLTAVPVAVYLVSALLLRVTFGYAFPLLSVAAWIAALNLVQTVTFWSARNMVGPSLGNLVATVAWCVLLGHRLDTPPGYDWEDVPHLWPAIFDFPLTDYALIAAIGLASFGVTVAAVTRQRRGDAPHMHWPVVAVLLPLKWLLDLFRFQCPTSSATNAQVWFELKSSGWPVLSIGLAIAIVTPLVFAVTVPVVWLRPFAILWTGLSVLAAVFVGTSSALGIRIKRGRFDRSEFDTTLAAGSAWLAGLKVIVRSVCGLAVLIALGVSVRGSLSFIASGKGYEPLHDWQRAIEGAVGALTGYEQVALAVVVCIGFVVMGAWHSAFWTICERYYYDRRLHIASSLLLLHGLALALLELAGRNGLASESLVDVLFGATRWIAAAAIVLATVYLFWSAFAERVLTLRYLCGALLVSAAFGAAWLTMLRAAGVQLAGMPTTNAVSMLLPVLLPLTASVLAPWSLDRIRHT
jgi:hypothetical protein